MRRSDRNGVALSVKVSAVHRNQAAAQAFLRNYAESIQSNYQACSGCSTNPDYVSSLAPPTAFAPPTESVKYWDKTSAAFTAARPSAGQDPGLQQVTITLTSADQFVSESLTFTVRNTS